MQAELERIRANFADISMNISRAVKIGNPSSGLVNFMETDDGYRRLTLVALLIKNAKRLVDEYVAPALGIRIGSIRSTAVDRRQFLALLAVYGGSLTAYANAASKLPENSADGSIMVATENDYEAGRGVLGIYDSSPGARFRRVGEFDTGYRPA